jgi:hypothetical protein
MLILKKPRETVTKSVVLSFPGIMAPLQNNTNSAYFIPKIVSICRSQHIQVIKLNKIIHYRNCDFPSIHDNKTQIMQNLRGGGRVSLGLLLY